MLIRRAGRAAHRRSRNVENRRLAIPVRSLGGVMRGIGPVHELAVDQEFRATVQKLNFRRRPRTPRVKEDRLEHRDRADHGAGALALGEIGV